MHFLFQWFGCQSINAVFLRQQFHNQHAGCVTMTMHYLTLSRIMKGDGKIKVKILKNIVYQLPNTDTDIYNVYHSFKDFHSFF